MVSKNFDFRLWANVAQYSDDKWWRFQAVSRVGIEMKFIFLSAMTHTKKKEPSGNLSLKLIDTFNF